MLRPHRRRSRRLTWACSVRQGLPSVADSTDRNAPYAVHAPMSTRTKARFVTLSVRACTASEFLDTVHQAGKTVPVEQSPEWAQYDSVLPGREHWRYLVVDDGATPMAAISLTS